MCPPKSTCNKCYLSKWLLNVKLQVSYTALKGKLISLKKNKNQQLKPSRGTATYTRAGFFAMGRCTICPSHICKRARQPHLEVKKLKPKVCTIFYPLELATIQVNYSSQGDPREHTPTPQFITRQWKYLSQNLKRKCLSLKV